MKLIIAVKSCAVVLGPILLALAFVPAADTEILGDFVSHTACVDCHADIVKGWLTTPHARAFETLATQGPEKQTNPGCVKCHVVAFEADGGFIDMELTPELKGVQCESCHGPGARHAEFGESDAVTVKPDEALCRVCHTPGQDRILTMPKNPFWYMGQNRGDTMPTRPNIIALLILSLVATVVYAGDLMVSESSIDYGTVKEGPPVVKKITVTNTGAAALTIANVTAS